MKNHYTKELLITSTYSDRFCELGLTQATLLLQDAMTELFYTYQCDAIRLSQSHQVIWAVARTKLRYDGPIRWMDRVKLTAFPVKVSPVARVAQVRRSLCREAAASRVEAVRPCLSSSPGEKSPSS